MSNPYHEDELECCLCGEVGVELRWKGWATNTKPCDPICEDCYCDPSTDEAAGPSFDDLSLAANPSNVVKGMWGRYSPDEIEAASYREIKK
jgi:hypothetical protein